MSVDIEDPQAQSQALAASPRTPSAAASARPKRFVYPSRDGKRMAENTEQFNEIVRLKENFEIVYRDDPHVFVAGDLLWYPIEGDIKTRQAPDTMIAFGRPKGRRGSYVQCREGGIAPQVVFEVLSPGNRAGEMQRKFEFYQQFGVEEYYVYDPDRGTLRVWLRQGERLEERKLENGTWTSARTGVRMDISSGKLKCWRPDGDPFFSPREMDALKREAQERAAQLQTEKTLLQTEKTLLQTEKTQLQTDKTLLQTQKTELQTEKTQLQTEKTQLQTEKTLLQTQKTLLQTEKTRLEAENTRLQAEKERKEAEAARLKALLKAAGIDPDATA